MSKPHPVDVEVGQKIRQVRWQKGMTQTQLADRVGIKFQQIQKYETGANRVSASRLHDIAKVLEVPISTFFPPDFEVDGINLLSQDEVRLVHSYRTAPKPVQNAVFKLLQSLAGS